MFYMRSVKSYKNEELSQIGKKSWHQTNSIRTCLLAIIINLLR